jgi:hypothetical protein
MFRSMARSTNFVALCSISWAGAALVSAQSQSVPSAAFEVASVKQLEQSLQSGQYDLSFVVDGVERPSED